jgi:hypothetical protein
VSLPVFPEGGTISKAGGKHKAEHFAAARAEGYTDHMIAKPQFSLRSLLTAIAAASLIAGEAVGFPGWLAAAFAILITVLLPVMFVAGALYGRDSARAFCIGALVCWLTIHWTVVLYAPVGPNILLSGVMTRSEFIQRWNAWGNDWRAGYAVAWSLALLSGYLSVVVGWLVRCKSPNA